MCDKVHCYDAGAKCSFIFPAFPLNGINQTLQNIDMKGIIHCLLYGYKITVHQSHIVKHSDKHDLLLRFCHLLLRSDVSVQFERLILCLRIVHEDNLFVPLNNVQ